MVSQGRIDCQVGEMLSDGLGHITDHLDHQVSRKLVCRDMRWTVTGRENTGSETVGLHKLLIFYIKINYSLL